MFVLSLFVHCILHTNQSGSQLSLNQDAVDPLIVAGSPAVQLVTDPPITPHIHTPLPCSYTTSSCTPLPLELHIDEDGCSAPTSSSLSTVVTASSKSSKYSQIQQKAHGDTVTSEILHVESFSISSSIKPPTEIEVNSLAHFSITKESASPGPTARSSSPVVVSKSPLPESKNPSRTVRSKSPSSPDIKPKSPVPKSLGPSAPLGHSPQAAAETSDSPITLPATIETMPKSASPLTLPRFSSPIPKSPVTVPNISSPVTVPKSASPETLPRLSSPVPKIESPITIPHISCSPAVPKSSSPETVLKNTFPVRLSSPVTVPKSPAPVSRKTYTFPTSSSPSASPVSVATVPSSSLYAPPTESQGGEGQGLAWPCREPFLDDALDKLLSSGSTQAGENQPPAFAVPGEEDRSWEEEDGIYPDLSLEGTLTPMTEFSWMDECFTPSTCPGTPDATLDLPIQQPSAVERLSASGQVGGSA